MIEEFHASRCVFRWLDWTKIYFTKQEKYVHVYCTTVCTSVWWKLNLGKILNFEEKKYHNCLLQYSLNLDHKSQLSLKPLTWITVPNVFHKIYARTLHFKNRNPCNLPSSACPLACRPITFNKGLLSFSLAIIEYSSSRKRVAKFSLWKNSSLINWEQVGRSSASSRMLCCRRAENRITLLTSHEEKNVKNYHYL